MWRIIVTTLFVLQFRGTRNEATEEVLKKYDYESLRIDTCSQYKPFDSIVRARKVHITICPPDNSTDIFYVMKSYQISLKEIESTKVVYSEMRNNNTSNKRPIHKAALYGPTQIKIWNDCNELMELNITNSNLNYSRSGWLKQCTRLKSLRIQNTTLNIRILHNILSGIAQLEELKIKGCDLFELPDNFIPAVQRIKRLDLSHNNLQFVSFLSSHTSFEDLSYLDLSNNQLIHGASKKYFEDLMPSLQYLIVDHNPRLDICNWDLFIGDTRKLEGNSSDFRELRTISASFTGTSAICFNNIRSDKLFGINISNSGITEFQFQKLPAKFASDLTIDLRGNEITKVNFSDIDLKLLKEKLVDKRLTMLTNITLKCTCEDSKFSRAIFVLQNLSVRGVKCYRNFKYFYKLNCRDFECGGCKCREDSKGVTALCDNRNVTDIPDVKNMRYIDAESNLIKFINISRIPDSLEGLNLIGNQISRIDVKTATALFQKPNLLVTLSSNPITCDCENKQLLEILRNNREKVVDYDQLKCDGFGLHLRTIDEEKLCHEEKTITSSTISLAIICVVLVAASLLTGLFFIYGQEIRIFMYANGWCLWCLKQQESDSNKIYDVFVSFSHEDEKFVTEELLPGLEEEPCKYKTCIHLRDWVPGEMIPSQIVTSVQSSKRTIAVVSKSYVKSLWGLMEFRTAYASASHENRIRVIIIVIDDISLDDILDSELRLYMRTNTYLCWGDPWFWDKLRYSLPHVTEKQ